VVEEIREEIEHAVEHVPKPVRWTVRKLALLASLSILALIVVGVVTAALYFSNRTEWVARELTLFLNGTLAQRSDVSVEIGDIGGSLFSEVRLLRPRIRFRDGTAPPLLEAPAMKMKYSAWAMITGRGRLVDITIESPVIRLPRRADGSLRLPVWKTSGPGNATRRAFDVRLRLREGRLLVPSWRGGIEGLNLDAFVSTAQAARVQVRELKWKRGPWATRDLQADGEVVAGDSLLLVLRHLRTPDLTLSARGAWKKGSKERVVHADVQRVRWGWLAQATGARTFNVKGEGRISVDARGGSAWRGDFAASLTWAGFPVEGSGDFSWRGGRLELDPMVMVSAAGRLAGHAAWSRQGWEVGGDVRGGDPSNWAAIGIVNWPKGNLSGSFLYAVDTRRHSEAHLDATLGASEVEGWRADRAEVQVHFPVTGPDSFQVHMWRLGGDVTLIGASAEGGWQGRYVARGFPLEEWPDGRASGIHGLVSRGEGTVAGRGGDLRVTGALSGVTSDWLGAHMARWELDEVNGLLLPKPDLTAMAHLEDIQFLGVHIDSAGIAFHLGDQAVGLNELRAQAGDTLFTATGHGEWFESGWRLAFDRAEAISGQFHWTADPPVTFSGDRWGVVFDRLTAHDGNARLDITGRWGAPGGSFDWTANAQRLDLSRAGMPPEWGLAGSASGRLQIRGRAEDPIWTLEAACSRPGWQGHLGDSLALSMGGRPSAFSLRHGFFRLGMGAVNASGTVEGTTHPWPDTLTAEGTTRWLATAERWDGKVRVEQLPLDHLERLAPAAKGWTGELWGDLTIGGSPGRPELQATVDAHPLSWQGYRVDDLQARAAYRDARLQVSELRMNRKSLASTIAGEMPLRLGLGAKAEVPEEPMAWQLDMPNGDLSVLPLFVAQIGAAAGKLEVRATIRGTPRHPTLDGTVLVRDGQLRLAGRDEVLKQLRADGRLDESRVTLDSLSARQGQKGMVFGKGAVEVSGTGLKGYRFDLKMRDFTASETGLYAAEFDGDFTVTDGTRVNGQVLPMVAGSMDVRRAVILFDFANQSEVQRIAATTRPLFWTYRIQVNATDNLKWQPPDGDIEFSANLIAEQTPERLNMDGEMHALRGTYYFLSNRFTVTQADLTFRSVDGANPEITAAATTRVVPSREPALELGAPADARSQTHTVTVSITGKSTEPVIAFASDPPDWDEARILQELTVGRFFARGVTLGDPLDNYLTRAINKTLSAEMSRAFRGYVSEWEVQREQGGVLRGRGDVIVGVGTQLTPNLQLRFRQRVPGLAREYTGATASENPFERDVEAEYRIGRFFYVTSELTQPRSVSGATSTVGEAPEFNVNLKARWEF
jgi:hypothetical protein